MGAKSKRVQRTYKIDVETERQLKALAAQMGVFESHIVDKLLIRALAEVAAGRWRFDRVPVKFELRWG